jgi:hypothetical protein
MGVQPWFGSTPTAGHGVANGIAAGVVTDGITCAVE